MKLLLSQKNKLAELIANSGKSINDFEKLESLAEFIISARQNADLYFQFRLSIQGAEFCDIYYVPTKLNASNHIYKSINSFEEALPYFQEWLDCLSEELGVIDKWWS